MKDIGSSEWLDAFANAAAFAAGNGNWVCPLCLNVLMWGCDDCRGHGSDEPHAPYPRPRASAIALKRRKERAEIRLRAKRRHSVAAPNA